MAELDHIAPRIEPTVRGLGYELWGIERSRSGENQTLRVYIDSPAGISVEDCEAVSRQVADLLEVDELLQGSYTLEVSSPGVERILFYPAQWERYVGSQVQVRLRTALDGRRKIVGVLLRVEGETATVEDEQGEHQLRLSAVERARLVPDWQSLIGAGKQTARKGARRTKDREEK